MKNIALLLFSVFALSGCLKDEFKKVAGTYEGVQIQSGSKLSVLAIISHPIEENGFYRVSVEIYEPGADLDSEILTISFKNGDDSKLWIDFPYFQLQDLELKVSQRCASAAISSSKEFKLCWKDSKITIILNSPDRKNTLFDLDLEKVPPSGRRHHRYPQNDPYLLPKGMVYSLETVLNRARFRNYDTLKEFEKVFEAKDKMNRDRAKLLPHLSIPSILGIGLNGPMALIDSVGTLFPFISPASWYRWDRSSKLYQAERFSYASLIANELNEVHGLYYSIHRDLMILNVIDHHIEELSGVSEQLRKQELLGAVAAGTTAQFNIHVGEMKQDKIDVEALIEKQLSSLAYALALSPLDQDFKIKDLESLPPVEEIMIPSSKEVSAVAIDRSLELQTLDELVKAAKVGIKDAKYKFFDFAGNGTFGPSTPFEIAIERSQVRQLEVEVDSLKARIEEKSRHLELELDRAIKSYNQFQGDVKLIEETVEQLIYKPLEAGFVNIRDEGTLSRWIDLVHKHVEYESGLITALHAVLIAQANLDRLTLSGVYEQRARTP